jgi:hypothetical protein
LGGLRSVPGGGCLSGGAIMSAISNLFLAKPNQYQTLPIRIIYLPKTRAFPKLTLDTKPAAHKFNDLLTQC